MPPPHGPWRNDGLGARLRAYFWWHRRAEPSDAVWRRVAQGVEPRRQVVRLSPPTAAGLSIAVLAIAAFTSLTAEIAGVQGRVEIAYEDRVYGYGLTEIEEQVAQRAAVTAAFDLLMPPLASPGRLVPLKVREAYNRAAWLYGRQPRAGGVAQPLTVVANL
jgi:hypothetical protein